MAAPLSLCSLSLTWTRARVRTAARRLRRAIWGMMPTNKLRYQRMTRLKMYPTAEHTHEAQFRGLNNKAFKAILPGHAVQLERIRPALESSKGIE